MNLVPKHSCELSAVKLVRLQLQLFLALIRYFKVLIKMSNKKVVNTNQFSCFFPKYYSFDKTRDF